MRICQDRREEKAFLSRAGIPVVPNQTLQPGEPLPTLPASLPRHPQDRPRGYDGKGQWTIQAADQLPATLAASGVPCVLEQRLTLEGEFSLTLARSPSGAIGALPLVQNWHSGGILDQTRSPAKVPALEADARRIAEQLIAALDYVGVLTVEFFLVAGKLLVNELAPRPHNSGHPSLDNAECSQFELQVRALCDLPLPARIAVRPAMLLNLLGDLWQAGTPDWAALLALPGVHLHLYGKGNPAPTARWAMSPSPPPTGQRWKRPATGCASCWGCRHAERLTVHKRPGQARVFSLLLRQAGDQARSTDTGAGRRMVRAPAPPPATPGSG